MISYKLKNKKVILTIVTIDFKEDLFCMLLSLHCNLFSEKIDFKSSFGDISKLPKDEFGYINNDGLLLNKPYAEKNRNRLRTSLIRLEKLLGKDIDYWHADNLINKNLIYRYGFK